jgi:hypothetical protein
MAGPYEGLEPFGFGVVEGVDVGTGTYDADYPDTFSPESGASAALSYAGGIGGVAAVAFRVDGGAAVINFGFPFETIVGAETRTDVMARTLSYFGVEKEPPTTSGSGGAGGGGQGGGQGLGGGRSAGDEGLDHAGCACHTVGLSPTRAPMFGLAALGLFAAVGRRVRRSRTGPSAQG